MILLESIFFGFWALNLVLIICELGQRSSDTCSSYEEELITKLDWYLYPLEMQRMMIPMIIYSKKPVEFKFFGSLSCSREQFKKVSDSVFDLVA